MKSMNRRVLVEAPAKINLFLEITGRRDDGYHLLDTVMQAVTLSDAVLIGTHPQPGIRVTCSRPGVPEDESNLAYRAATALLAAAGMTMEGGLHIHIDKHIPHEAGLGGGSSDAAAVLVGLNQLLGAHLDPRRLEDIGVTLGADVPFALRGGCSLCRGVGEEMDRLVSARSHWSLVLAKPGAGMSTREAYARWDEAPPRPRRHSGALTQALEMGDLAATGMALYNAFEGICPGAETRRISATMADCGAAGAVLSGSGSAVAGLFPCRDQAQAAAAALKGTAAEIFLATPVDHGAQIVWRD